MGDGDMGNSNGRTTDTTADPPRERTLSPDVLKLDHVFAALDHPRRRYLCYTLSQDTKWSLTDLATKVAAWENDVPERAVTDDQRERVYVSLYHAHVPKLVDEGVISFDAVNETISAADHADQVVCALVGLATNLEMEQEIHAREEMDDHE